MMNRIKNLLGIAALALLTLSCQNVEPGRVVQDFNEDWQFALSDGKPSPDQDWRSLHLPHDWSIEGAFSPDHPAGVGGGALPGGIGWYKKTFELKPDQKDKKVFIQFDGIYQNSTVWINGTEAGNRPNGYISFEYDITDLVHFRAPNEIIVKVANDPQPNSRWYSGSGIYRDVRLVTTGDIYVPQWGTYITSKVNVEAADVTMAVDIVNESEDEGAVEVKTIISDGSGATISTTSEHLIKAGQQTIIQEIEVPDPVLWSVKNPNLYTATVEILRGSDILDQYETTFGIRTFQFDPETGFSLNGESMKLRGVCLHHDLGPLGAAFNERAMQRQLEIMKEMGANAIRTAHNPPAPEVLDLCDEMGILVMDEMFDMWAAGKTEHDYSQYWDEWHEQDLRDFIKRDRNHPSIVVWSVGNEIIEQYNHADSTGAVIARRLADIVRSLDDRPIITANNDATPDNPLIKDGGLDIVGYNYNHEKYKDVPNNHPGMPFIATETNSSLATRGYYDMPSDSVRVWPEAWDKLFEDGNPDNTVSAYDHVRTPWGSTQEDTWRIVKKHDFMSGLFIWTGFDYLGEPTPYVWPSRSSYFGLVDLAGFPKDSYYMYQSEWTDDPMLHVFPHWNLPAGRSEGEEVDVWAYYSNADEVELFLNGKSQGVRQKGADDFHVMWRVNYEPGSIRVVSRKDGEEVLVKEVETAGKPHHLELTADRKVISSEGNDLSFITVQVMDEQNVEVPDAAHLIQFKTEGGTLVALANGDPTNHQSFLASERNVFNGRCLAVVGAHEDSGAVRLTATAEGLVPGEIEIRIEREKI